VPQSYLKQSRTWANFTLKFFVLLVTLAALIGGCQRPEHKPLPEEEIHRITREFVFAANSVVPPGSEVHGEVGAFDKVANSSDRIEIHIPAKREGNSYPPAVAKIIQKFSGIASARGLTQDPQTESSDAIFLNYRHAGLITHTIHIHMGGTDESRKSGSPAPLSAGNQPARLAIILDDLGNDRAAADTIFALPYPLTISILPNHVHSVEIAEQAHRRGDEVMLHLPMQSLGKEHAESEELRSGMSRSQVSALINQFLDRIPGVRGVNNHQGSQSTSDTKLMSELMPILQQRKLFYIDSRTSPATVAYDTALRFGVRAASRNVPFLDDVENVAAVRKQINIAIADAAKKKEAIAIGHAHASTLEALKETLPEAQAHGVRLVFASELVR
jgi:polysaccharide deacetylase 2 family uncharacterized protein YibQ